ncbi:sugar phosphate isomerase/epimerase family protein [Paenibacillus sp.]|uniref:sugar phosphate isomerase/epimerase family protein n=1 Tax=Paenibacillus sp. TaxID=58172 RepID=UPI00281125D8|nr:sugar phosphate isomerase/epimerase family protein [Paenibacillus sp.]
MKLSVFTVATPDLTPAELIPIAKEAGLDGLEWRYTSTAPERRNEAPSFWGNNLCTIDPATTTDEELDALAEAVRGHGLTTAALTPYLTAGDVEGTERAMRHAARLGAKAIRVGVPRYDRTADYNDLFSKAVAYLESVEALSKKYGVKGLVETHHQTITASASLAHRLVGRFSPEHVGVLYDPGNLIHEGYENFRMGLELLGPHLAHVHVKNAGWFPGETAGAPWTCRWVAMDRGIVDWKQVLADLKSVGYDGWFGVEDFSGTHDTKTMLATYAVWFRSLAEQA